VLKLKKAIAIALCGATFLSVNIGETADKKASATPTMVQGVTIPQVLMNPNENANYVLIWHHFDSGYYIDLSSIVIKENDDLKWWAQNIVEINDKGAYINQFTQEFCFDETVDKSYANTRQWDKNTRKWENLNIFDTRSRYQVDARGFSLGYIYAFQGGNPVEK
jgi:hypothetical protein